jgi:hypothetical protein
LLFEQPSRAVAEIGSKIIEQQVYVERGEMVSIVASCGASGQCLPPIKVTFLKGVKGRISTGFVKCLYPRLVGLKKIASSNG